MKWLRLVGSLKLQVIFAKEPYKRDYILQKRPIILRSLLPLATPYWQIRASDRSRSVTCCWSVSLLCVAVCVAVGVAACVAVCVAVSLDEEAILLLLADTS